MGFPKPLLEIHGRTFVEHLATLLLETVEHVTVVVGAEADRVRRAIPHDPRISTVLNPDYSRGQLSSLKVALPLIGPGIDAAMVHLCDHPLIRSDTVRELVDAFRAKPSAIVVPRYRERRGHPVIFPRLVFAELMSAFDEQGARVVVNRDENRVRYVEVEDPGICLDLDTPEELERTGLKMPRITG